MFGEARGSCAALPGEAGTHSELRFLREMTLQVPWLQPALLGLEAWEAQAASLSDALTSPASGVRNPLSPALVCA